MADLDPGLVAKALYGRRWDVLASTGADVSVIDTWDARLSRDKRILQLEVERDEYKQMAFRALNVGERVVSVAEARDRT